MENSLQKLIHLDVDILTPLNWLQNYKKLTKLQL